MGVERGLGECSRASPKKMGRTSCVYMFYVTPYPFMYVVLQDLYPVRHTPKFDHAYPSLTKLIRTRGKPTSPGIAAHGRGSPTCLYWGGWGWGFLDALASTYSQNKPGNRWRSAPSRSYKFKKGLHLITETERLGWTLIGRTYNCDSLPSAVKVPGTLCRTIGIRDCRGEGMNPTWYSVLPYLRHF